MAQNVHDPRQVLPCRPVSADKTELGTSMPGQPQIARPSRMIAALKWLFHLLFVQPVGRRARLERLGRLSDHALRDIGLMRADTSGYTTGLVALQDYPADHANVQPLAPRAQPRHALTVVRLHEAA